MNKKFQKWLPH